MWVLVVTARALRDRCSQMSLAMIVSFASARRWLLWPNKPGLLLDHAFTDDLVDGGLNKRNGDCLA